MIREANKERLSSGNFEVINAGLKSLKVKNLDKMQQLIKNSDLETIEV